MRNWEPYKSGYREVAICLNFVLFRYRIPIEWQGMQQSTNFGQRARLRNMNGLSSKDIPRDEGLATLLREVKKGGEKDILKQEITSVLINDKKKTNWRISPTAKPEKVKNTTTTTTIHHKLSAKELVFLATEIQWAINLKLNSVHKCPVITGVTKNDTQQGILYRNRHIIFTHYFMYTRLSIKYLIKINQSLILLILLKDSVIYTVTGKESWYYCVDPGPVKKVLW